MQIFDKFKCHLGEGPIWHSEIESLIWFDILEKKMFSKNFFNDELKVYNFNEFVSSAGIIDKENLLINSEKGLKKFNLNKNTLEDFIFLEAENELTRSNDGRVDTYGGYWISTMGKRHERNLGSIYRYYNGEIKKLFSGLSIPNSICFSPCGKLAYFADTIENKILRVNLDSSGWPKGKEEIFLNFSDRKLKPDGSIVDSEGCIWNAQWGSSNVSKYDKNGHLLETINLQVPLVTCPVIGGKNKCTLFVTTAREGMNKNQLKIFPDSGCVFMKIIDSFAQKEVRIKL